MTNPTSDTTRARATRPGAENGSAYLFALLVLLVLTVIGLSLAIITQSEVQIGAAERTGVRVFYDSDAAIRVQVSSAFTSAGEPREFQLHPATSVGSAAIASKIHASALLPLDSGNCSLCNITTGTRKFWTIDHIVTGRTERTSTVGGDETLYAEKTITSMFAISPQPQSITPLRSSDYLDDIRP